MDNALVSPPRSPNQFLAALPAADYELMHPHLRTVELVHEAVLLRAGDPFAYVYFPHSGVISLVVSLAEGGMVEAAMVGRDSVFGASAALDGLIALNDAIVQQPGTATILDVAYLRAAAERSANLRTTLMRHEQMLLVQALQSAACNASHSVESRLSQWLLRMRDLSGNDTFLMTQEFLAQMLGVRRNAVSLVAHTLQQAGLIRYRRGHIEITNLDGLRESTCECYGAVKTQYDRLLNAGR
jgi:CRP-like cAMP-binding protein